jgi:DNA-binding NarL/FixJ family response regulator
VKPIRVVLADDHTLVREGISALLERTADIEVVGQASDGQQALLLMEKKHPDVAVIDVSLPVLSGLDVVGRAAKQHPNVRILILSLDSSEEYVLQALRLGAAGYLVKNATVQELEMAIRALARGENFLSPLVSKLLVDEYLRRAVTPVNPLEHLTPRQQEILRLIAEGRSTKAIARTLQISAKTVETHRAQLMERLSIYDVPGLVRYAIRTGVVTPEHGSA